MKVLLNKIHTNEQEMLTLKLSDKDFNSSRLSQLNEDIKSLRDDQVKLEKEITQAIKKNRKQKQKKTVEEQKEELETRMLYFYKLYNCNSQEMMKSIEELNQRYHQSISLTFKSAIQDFIMYQKIIKLEKRKAVNKVEFCPSISEINFPKSFYQEENQRSFEQEKKSLLKTKKKLKDVIKIYAKSILNKEFEIKNLQLEKLEMGESIMKMSHQAQLQNIHSFPNQNFIVPNEELEEKLKEKNLLNSQLKKLVNDLNKKIQRIELNYATELVSLKYYKELKFDQFKNYLIKNTNEKIYSGKSCQCIELQKKLLLMKLEKEKIEKSRKNSENLLYSLRNEHQQRRYSNLNLEDTNETLKQQIKFLELHKTELKESVVILQRDKENMRNESENVERLLKNTL